MSKDVDRAENAERLPWEAPRLDRLDGIPNTAVPVKSQVQPLEGTGGTIDSPTYFGPTS